MPKAGSIPPATWLQRLDADVTPVHDAARIRLKHQCSRARGNDLYVAIRDKNGDDTFGYLVDFVVIPTTLLNVSTGIQRGNVV